MRLRMLPFLILACLFFSGCPAYSVHPLSTDDDAVAEPALVGTWIDTSDDEPEFVFQQSGAHEYSLGISDPNSRVKQNYKVTLVRLGDQLFMDLIFTDQTVNGTKIDDPLGAISSHMIAKVNVTADDLAVAMLEDDPIQKQNIPGGSPLSYVATDGGLLITAHPDALRRYISTHPNDAFSDFTHLTRKSRPRVQP
jgi:hypothetical protein